MIDEVDVEESRESERDMATDTDAGVILDVGDVKNIFKVRMLVV